MFNRFARTSFVALIGTGQIALAEVSETCLANLDGQRMTIVVPNAPGGGNDTYARAIAPSIEEHSALDVRVVNMPSGNGLAALSFVANAPADEIIALVENTNDLIATEIDSDATGRHFLIEKFDILGIFLIEPDTWLGRPDFDILDPALAQVISAQGSAEGSIISVNLAAMGMGLEGHVVSGYEGSGDMAAAVLRNESDITALSAASSSKNAASGDLEILLAISDGPWAQMPDLPYLAGEDSVAWARTENLEDAEKLRLRGLATTAANLGGTVRSFHISQNVPQERRDCLMNVVGMALEDPVFKENAETQGRPVGPVVGQAARDRVERGRVAFNEALDIIDELMAALN